MYILGWQSCKYRRVSAWNINWDDDDEIMNLTCTLGSEASEIELSLGSTQYGSAKQMPPSLDNREINFLTNIFSRQVESQIKTFNTLYNQLLDYSIDTWNKHEKQMQNTEYLRVKTISLGVLVYDVIPKSVILTPLEGTVIYDG